MDTNKRTNKFLSVSFIVIASLALSTALRAQSPVPSPSTSSTTSSTTAPVPESNYQVTSSVEFGVRGLSQNGDVDKFRSDLNYRAGFRTFDSSFLVENKKGDGPFDSALLTTSGWGADPSGAFRMKMDKNGIYKFDANVRRVTYYNNLISHAVVYSRTPTTSLHFLNTNHQFGDFDFTLFPESDLRFKVGYSFNHTSGPGLWTIRLPAFSGPAGRISGDETAVNSENQNRSDDFRFGVDDKILGFNVGLNYGHRTFKDSTRFFADSSSFIGTDTNPATFITSFTREVPTKGTNDYVNFYSQRTFAKKLDYTGRIIYSLGKTTFTQADMGSGGISSTTNPLIALDQINTNGSSRRPQTRADVGLTYRATDKFTISNTFTFDQFHISGGNVFLEYLISRTSAGLPRPDQNSSIGGWREQDYRRLSNLIEADYQVNDRLGFNFGYRYTNRKVNLGELDFNFLSTTPAVLAADTFTNKTNTFIAGTRIKPMKNWSIYADLEKGTADNPFTRLANNDVFNFRVRSVTHAKQFTLNLSAVIKDNKDPGSSEDIAASGTMLAFPTQNTVADTKSRYFSGSLDWTPRSDLSISGGYTMNRQTANTDIIVPVGAPLFPTTQWYLGKSFYYLRENYFFFDVSARPINRVSLYASYRISDDKGQGNLAATRPQDIITSFPLRYQTPEVRMVIKLTKNVDWNLGYQYYSYKEIPKIYPFIAQNYTAHMPYTSLRIYFGRHIDTR